MGKKQKKKKQGSKSVQVNMFLISFIPMILMSTIISIIALNGATAKQLVIAISVIVVMALISILSISGSVAKAIKNAEECILQLSNGELNIIVDQTTKNRNDEIGRMGEAICELSEQLKNIVSDLKTSSEDIFESGNRLETMGSHTSDSVYTINQAMTQISDNSLKQTTDVNLATMKTEEMAKLISGIVSNAKALTVASELIKNDGEESVVIMQQLHHSNSRTNEAVEKIDYQIHLTNEAVRKINAAITVITNIAKQTSLLALNASIEAARAGENGKGFSVVAEEIGKLAFQSNQSAKEIGDNLIELNNESEKTVLFMGEVVKNIGDQKEKLNQTMERFLKVNDGIYSNQTGIGEIHNQIEICDSARGQVVQVIKSLAAASETNTAATEETTASMYEVYDNVQQLNESAKKLKEVSLVLDQHIKFFK
jgi:methyl-accepting chemotaxis protein